MLDAQPLVVPAAEAVGHLQQRLGHAAGDVGEDQVGDGVVGAAQAAGQHAQQLLGEINRSLLQAGLAVVRPGDPNDAGVLGVGPAA